MSTRELRGHWFLLVIGGLLWILALSGCHGDAVSTKSSVKQRLQVTESCTKSGWCHHCSGSGDRRRCGYGHSFRCPGVRNILEDHWTDTVTYEDGYVGTYERSSKVKSLGSCR